MRTMKRLMALMVCIAMLASGFALADAPAEPTPGQEKVQDVTNPEVGGRF